MVNKLKKSKIKSDPSKYYRSLFDNVNNNDLQVAHTPFEVVKQMCSKLKIKDTDKILVLYNIEFATYLITEMGVKQSQIIIYNNSKIKSQLLEMAGYKVIYQESFNKNKSITDMKFDVLVGNPPFDNANGAKNVKLWNTFAKQSIKLAKTVALVTPNNVISERGKNGENLRSYIKKYNYGFIFAENHETDYFKGYGVSTCHWGVTSDSDDLIDPIIIKNGIKENPIVASIVSKVINSKFPKLQLKMDNGHIQRNSCNKNKDNLHTNKIIYSGSKVEYTSDLLKGSGDLKLVFPFSSSYKKMFTTNEQLGMLNLYINIKDTKEGQDIIKYANSKLFNLVANNYKKTSGFTPFVKQSQIPDLRGMNCSGLKLYKHFNLTQEEIDYIENEVK